MSWLDGQNTTGREVENRLAHSVQEEEGDAGVAATAVPTGIGVGAGTTAAAPQHPVPPVAWGGGHWR
jgi:hypothetical protein